MSRGVPPKRRVMRALRRNPRVEVREGAKHLKVYVDDSLVTVLPRGAVAEAKLHASLRELRGVGVDVG